jgi:hypothetical protein
MGADATRPYSAGKYEGRIGERQRAFIANVLRETPAERLVVAEDQQTTRGISSARVANEHQFASFQQWSVILNAALTCRFAAW